MPMLLWMMSVLPEPVAATAFAAIILVGTALVAYAVKRICYSNSPQP